MDIWGIGCILAEMLTVSQIDHSSSKKPERRHLLPGASCHPLTPRTLKEDKTGFVTDQLELSLQMIAKPDDDDMAFVSGKKALDYLKLQAKSAHEKSEHKESLLRRRFASIENQALVDILEDLLQLNPAFRPSAAELIKHSIFDSVRNQAKEVDCPEKVSLSAYNDWIYDYENDKPVNWTKQDVR